MAEEIVEEFGSYLGYALANVAVVTDPEVIVIGGGVSRAGDILSEICGEIFPGEGVLRQPEYFFRACEAGK